VSNAEAERIKAELNKPQGEYHAVTNNCSTVARRALDKGLGKPIPKGGFEDAFETPTDLHNSLRLYGRVVKTTTIKPKSK
jgi:hypothetical protein